MSEGIPSRSLRTPVRPEIEVLCSACGRVVPAGGGVLGIDLDAVMAAERASAAFEASHSDGHGGTFSSLEDLLELPDSVPWTAWHWGCNPNTDALAYEIAVEQVATWRQVIDWTAHLSDKSWLPTSDWHDMLRALATGSSRLLREGREAP